MKKTKTEIEQERLKRNREIAEQVREGTYIPPAFDREASFYPPRGKIKKDKKAIQEIFGEDAD